MRRNFHRPVNDLDKKRELLKNSDTVFIPTHAQEYPDKFSLSLFTDTHTHFMNMHAMLVQRHVFCIIQP